MVADLNADKSEQEERVPLIDLAWGKTEAAQAMHDACVASGFFYVSNHGLDTLMAEQFKESKNFFDCTMGEKNEILMDGNSRGFTPAGEQSLDPENQTEGDTKEGLYFGREVAADSEEAKYHLHGPNQWPNPERLPNFRPAMEAYFEGVLAVGMRLLRFLALSLELPEEWFVERYSKPIALMRPLHYGAKMSKPEEGIFGCGAHSDFGVLTLLATDGTPGLQIRRNDKWVDVPSLPGTIVVNLGDMLERWTSYKYTSTLHRVISCTGTERYSTAFFLVPDSDTVVDPTHLPTCCPPGTLPKWEPITSGEYMVQRYNDTHASFADTPGAHAAK